MAQYDVISSGTFTSPAFIVSSTSIITDATTARTLALTDNGRKINMTSGSANTVTVPPNSSVAFPVNAEVSVRQGGAGATTIVAGSGVTLEYPATGTLVLAERYVWVTLVKMATDTWSVVGRLAAA